MVTGKAPISTQYQARAGDDIAAILGTCKHVFAAEDDAKTQGHRVIDAEFVERHTHGFAEFEAKAMPRNK
jgi:anaerobic selenocysteine-containing dehydrogenase